MVEQTMLMQRKASARPTLTPGDIAAHTSKEMYMGQGYASKPEYSPAKSGSRRVPVNEALHYEAAGLQDAGLDFGHASLRSSAGTATFRVYGNNAFDGDEYDEPSASGASPSAKTPGAIKMNNLFGGGGDSPSTRTPPHNQHMHQQPSLRASRDTTIEKSRTIGRLFSPPGGNGGNTVVEAFDSRQVIEEDEPCVGPIVARARQPSAAVGTSHQMIAAWEQELRVMMNNGHRVEAVQRAAPSEGMVKCYVKRVKNFFGTHCSFQMHLESGDIFLMAARRRKKSKVSSYVLSMDLEDLKRDTPNCMAKLKSNFVGTEYMLWGKSEDRRVKKGYAREQLCINYKASLGVTGGPRQMYVTVPLPEEEWQPEAADGSDSLSNVLELAKAKEMPPYLEKKMAMLTTKPPEWDDNLNAYTLDFKGRVKEASVKNFQLVAWDHNTDRKGVDVVLQFGKVSEDIYSLDFAYPLTPEVAFAVALASIDTKLCYTL